MNAGTRLWSLIGAVALIALLWSRQFNEPLSYYSSRSYVDRTNDLIRRGALKFDCGQDRVMLTDSASAAEREWFGASYLQQDVELFNRDRELFGHFFVVTDCQLRGINPFLRTIRLPFAKSTQWLGSIEYSGTGSDASLLSANGRTIAIARTAADQLPQDARTIAGDSVDLSANVVHIDFAGAGQTPGVEVHSVEGTAVVEQRLKRGQAAEVRLTGNAVDEGRIARLVSGDWLHLSATSPALASETFLYSGERRYERLSTVRTRNALRQRVYSEDDPLLQWVGGDDGEQMLTFGEALASSVTNAVQQVDPKRAEALVEGFDLQLSINRSLQSRLDAALAAQARRLMNDIAGGQPFAASITVMDGKSGELLAIASFPGQSDLASMTGVSEDEQRRLLVNHNFKRHPIGSAGKPFIYAAVATQHPFLLDLTVEPHAPLMREDGGDGEREVLQFFLGDDYKLWPHADARIDLQSALERSCNKYTVELATLALAAPRDLSERHLTRALDQVFARQAGVLWPRPGKTDGPQIGGQRIDFPIDLGVYMKDDGRPVAESIETTAVVTPGTLDRMDEPPFIESFGDITGVRTYGGGSAPDLTGGRADRIHREAMVTLNYDLRPWRTLLAKLMESESDEVKWRVRAALQAVSPERVNLSNNQVTNYRTEFVSVLLGGASSTWTNVQLAEAMSRLVTKKQVEATMVHEIRPRNPVKGAKPVVTAPVAPLRVSDEARDAVLRGMRRVISGQHGTAKPMMARVGELERRFPGYKVAVFSKTGSPTVERAESKPAGEIVRQLLHGGLLIYDGRQLAVMLDRTGKPMPYAAAGAPGRARFVAALTRASRSAGRRLRRPVEPRTVTRIVAFCDRFARYRSDLVFASPDAVRLNETATSPFHVVAGALVLNRHHSIFGMEQQADSSAVYLLSIAKWKGEGDIPTVEELQQNDARVITVAVYLDLGPGSAVAVEVTRALLPEIVGLLE